MCALDRVKASVEAELKVWDQPSIAVGVIKDGKVESDTKYDHEGGNEE